MKTLVFYRAGTESEARLRAFFHDVEGEGSTNVERVDVNTRDGDAKAAVYDIISYPAVLVVAEDGSVIREWRENLPLLREISYYLHQE